MGVDDLLRFMKFSNDRFLVIRLSAGFEELLIISEHRGHIGVVRSQSFSKNPITRFLKISAPTNLPWMRF